MDEYIPVPTDLPDEIRQRLASINSATAVRRGDFGPPSPRGERGQWNVGSAPPNNRGR